MAVFGVSTPCSLIEIGTYCLHHQDDQRSDDEGRKTSEMSGRLYQTIRRGFPEDSHLYTRRREDLKSHIN